MISRGSRPSDKGGGLSSTPWDKGGPGLKKKFNGPSSLNLVKNKGGGGEGAGSLGPSPGPAADDIEHQIFIHIDFVSMTRCFPTQPRPQGLFVFQYVGEKRED